MKLQIQVFFDITKIHDLNCIQWVFLQVISMLKKAIQTITWGDPQHDLFEYIFNNAQKAGFDGLEIGFRRLIKRKTDDIKVLLEKYNIQISASHVGGNLADLTQADDEKSGLENIINVLTELGIKKLVYSGLNVTEDEALNAEIHQIKEFSERCGGIFDEIDEVISERERKDFMAKYKQAAGFKNCKW